MTMHIFKLNPTLTVRIFDKNAVNRRYVSLSSSLCWYVHPCEISRHSGYYLPRSAELKFICWALIFIIRIRFWPGKSLATIFNKRIRRSENAARKRHVHHHRHIIIDTLYLISRLYVVPARLFHYFWTNLQLCLPYSQNTNAKMAAATVKSIDLY